MVSPIMAPACPHLCNTMLDEFEIVYQIVTFLVAKLKLLCCRISIWTFGTKFRGTKGGLTTIIRTRFYTEFFFYHKQTFHVLHSY